MVRNKTKKNKKSKSKVIRRKKAFKRDKGKTTGNAKLNAPYQQSAATNKTKIVILLTVLLVICAIFYFIITYHAGSEYNQIKAHTEKAIADNIYSWERNYPEGFKVVTIYNDELIESGTDTLPGYLLVNWKETMLLRPRPEELKEHPGMSKIKLTGVTSFPSNVIDMDITTSFIKEKGMTAPVIKLGGKTLYFQLIEVYENSLVCLFGVR